MRKLIFAVTLSVTGCIVTPQKKEARDASSTEHVPKNPSSKPEYPAREIQLSTPTPTYSNDRFKEVRVEKLSETGYLITGKGQIFEASFGWVVEDGHNQLKGGHEMTDAGAPEWGNFRFIIDVGKKTPNKVLHVILFETSAKDGSRQHELPIRLP